MSEMPSFLSTSYANAHAMVAPMGGAGFADWQKVWREPPQKKADDEAQRRVLTQLMAATATPATAPQPQPKEMIVVSDKRRLVRVLVVDPHEDVPVESGLLYDSKEVFTDKTDQELYFDVPVAQLLKEHNEKRTKVVNKSVKDRTEYLEPARIRDLKMLVIALATF